MNYELGKDKQDKDVAIVERPGLLGQMTVQPLEVQGNNNEHPLRFVYEWSKFFSLPAGRMESIYSLGVWGFVGNLLGCTVTLAPWLTIPAILILLLTGLVSYYTPELALVICLRLFVVILMTAATMIVL